MMEIILRKEATRQGLRHYFTGKECRNGHLEPRFVNGGKCMQCARDAVMKYAKENPKKVQDRLDGWRRDNQENIAEYNRSRWNNVKDDPEKLSHKREADRRYTEKPEVRERKRQYDKTHRPLWDQDNREKNNARAAKRRSIKLKAAPIWLTDDDYVDILKIYDGAQKITTDTGILFVVDHIVPLKGKTVCGLHVPWNLQILSDLENKKKGTKIVSYLTRFPKQ